MAVITINGREFPAPDVGGNLVVATNVSSGKNANGEFVGQKVGRDQYKFDALQWKFLDAATWSAMLQEFDKFVVTARIPDMVNNRFQTIRMYLNSTPASPFIGFQAVNPKNMDIRIGTKIKTVVPIKLRKRKP